MHINLHKHLNQVNILMALQSMQMCLQLVKYMYT